MTASYLSHAVMWIWHVAQLCAVGLGVWALIDTVRRSDQHFIAADKRTKRFWLAVNAVGVALVTLMGAASMLGLLGVVANAVYLADVRPALNYYRSVRVRSRIRRPGRGESGRGAGGRRR